MKQYRKHRKIYYTWYACCVNSKVSPYKGSHLYWSWLGRHPESIPMIVKYGLIDCLRGMG